MGFLRTETVTRRWSYVGENADLRRAAEDVLRCWDEMADIKTWGMVIANLRAVVQGERRMSWTADYDEGYDKGEK